MNQRFLLRIEQQGRVSYLAVQGQLNALHMAGAYARQTPAQQILVLDATGRVLWNSVPRDALLPVPPAEETPSRKKSMAEENQPGLDEQLFGRKPDPTAEADSPLAEFITAWYREAHARAHRGRAAPNSQLPLPPSKPTS